MKRSVVVLGICMLFLSGCRQADNRELFSESVQATGEIFIPGERTSDPRYIQLYKDYVVVSNRKAASLIDVFDLKTGEKKTSFLSIGRGPLECLSATIQSDPEQGFVYVLDLMQQKMLRYDFEKLLTDSTTRPEIIYQHNEDSHLPFAMMVVGKEYMVASSSDPQGRILLLTKDGREKGYFVDYPSKELVDKNLADYNNASLYVSRVQVDPSGERVFLATYMAGMIDLFDLEKEGPKPIFSYRQFYPQGISVIPGKEQMVAAFSKESSMGFLSQSATDRYCYALFSGKAISDKKSFLGEQVYVTRWDGKQTYKIQLDQGISSIAVTPDDKILYGINENMDIVKFALPGF